MLRSELEQVLRSGQLAVTAELSPPDSADPQEVYKRAALFAGHVDALNATDGSGANCHMSSVGVCALLTRAGYSTVMQISCRDRNRIAIQGDILGAAAMGVRNILCLTGDGVQAGDQPDAKAGFYFYSIFPFQTGRYIRGESPFFSERELLTPPPLFFGAAANPLLPPVGYRPPRPQKKI